MVCLVRPSRIFSLFLTAITLLSLEVRLLSVMSSGGVVGGCAGSMAVAMDFEEVCRSSLERKNEDFHTPGYFHHRWTRSLVEVAPFIIFQLPW